MPKGRQAYWRSEDGLALIQGWAREGLLEGAIAAKMGIAQTTLTKWKEAYQEVKQALSTGKEATDYAVENALYKKAISGDTRAMVFWLKNRKPGVWRDKPLEMPEDDVEGVDGISESMMRLAEEMDRDEDDGII